MRTLVFGVISLVAAYLVGRWCFDRMGTTPTRGQAQSAAAAPGNVSMRPANMPEMSALPPPSVPSFVRSRSSVPSADELLEAMMTEHRDAMLMLREAVIYEYFKRGSVLAECGAHVVDATTCWVRFQCALHGQLMRLQIESIHCGVHHDVERQILPDDTLASCIRANLKIGDPLGIPAEAAEDLSDYAGPLEVSLPYAPE